MSFDTPDKAWSSALTRPTVNLFLWDLGPAVSRTTGLSEGTDASGARMRRVPPTQVCLSYIITAWATERSDEHELLGSVLACLLSNPRLPDDLTDALPVEGDVVLRLAAAGNVPSAQLWSALGGSPKPSLRIEVPIYFDIAGWVSTDAPVSAVAVEASPRPAPPRPAPSARAGRDGMEVTRRRAGKGLVMEGRRPNEP